MYGNVVMLPQRSALPGVSEAHLALARHLAGQVRTLSADELEQWGIRGQDSLSVRWHTAAEDLLDHWENIHNERGRTDRMALVGHFTAIRDTYRAITSKRLVIMGKAGAGKTVLAHRLILDLVDNAGATGPVPVLFSLGDWNPTATVLRAWLVRQLHRDFPFLESREPTTRKTAAESLVHGGLILPVLDGFDEIPDSHHRAAIREISNIDWPLVVTSRAEEYAEATRTVKAVGGAAAIELEDLAPEEAHRYLRQSTGKSRTPAWDTVFDHLYTAPTDAATRNLTPVLRTPLMVMLARTAYNDTPDHDPRVLLDTHRFPTRDALEEHLLSTYLTTLYNHRDRRTRLPNWAPENARHWLGHLATHLTQRGTHDLTWWHLPATLRRHIRVLLTTLTVALAGGLAYVLVRGLEVELAGALVLGLVVGFHNETRFSRGGGRNPERLRLRLRRRGRTRPSPATVLKKTAAKLGGWLAGEPMGWLVAVLVVVVVVMLVLGFSGGLVALLVYGLTLVLMYEFVNFFVSALGDNHDPHTIDPWTLLTRDRTVTLVRMIATTLAFGLAFAFVGGLEDGLAFGRLTLERAYVLGNGLVGGLVFGILGATARLVLSAWGNWLLFTRLWLPLTGRLPWRPKRFLEDAYRRGVLRRAGAVYQFRHARLRDHLARRYRAKSGSSPMPIA